MAKKECKNWQGNGHLQLDKLNKKLWSDLVNWAFCVCVGEEN